MTLRQGEAARIVFLMIGPDLATGIENLTPTTEVSIDGSPFVATVNQPVQTGGGWYYVDLDGSETAVRGPLVFRASDDAAAYQWRDIYRVEAPDADVTQAIHDAISQWQAQVAVPIQLVRIGES